MTCFVEGVQRGQPLLFPDQLDDWIGKDDLVPVVDLFIDELDPAALGFGRAVDDKGAAFAPPATIITWLNVFHTWGGVQ